MLDFAGMQRFMDTLPLLKTVDDLEADPNRTVVGVVFPTSYQGDLVGLSARDYGVRVVFTDEIDKPAIMVR